MTPRSVRSCLKIYMNISAERGELKNFDATILDDVTPAEFPPSSEPFTPEEVVRRIRKFENSSPGEDRLTYKHWLVLDPEGQLLHRLFNICLAHQRIPESWKHSRTILIHKKGDLDNPSNWRPIALCRTIFKIFTGLLATRLTEWLIRNDLLHNGQKGFLPYDGVMEHNYILQHRLREARRRNRPDVFLACVDFSDAFGSIPHQAIPATLEAYGAGEVFANVVRDLYHGCDTTVRCSALPVPVRAGVLSAASSSSSPRSSGRRAKLFRSAACWRTPMTSPSSRESNITCRRPLTSLPSTARVSASIRPSAYPFWQGRNEAHFLSGCRRDVDHPRRRRCPPLSWTPHRIPKRPE